MELTHDEAVLQLLIHDFSESLLGWQIIALALCLLIPFIYCWYVRARLIKRYTTLKNLPLSKAQNNTYWVLRGLFPVLSLVALLTVQATCYNYFSMALIRLGIVLQLTGLTTYIVVYSLSRFFSSGFLRAYARYISLAVWLFAVLYLTGLVTGVESALDDIRLPLGKLSVSLLDLFYALFLILSTLVASLWLGAFVDSRLMQMDQLDMSLRVVLARVVRTVFVVIAVLLAMSASGIDLTILSVFGGALGVGLGLGLQRIASNYISGFIVLLERSIRIGDVINVVGLANGWVTSIRTRYTLVKGFDGTEIMIPNENLVNNPVQTLTSKLDATAIDQLEFRSRQTISLVVSPDTDVSLALELLVAQALKQERVLKDPAPSALLSSFTPDGFSLELSFFVMDPHKSVGALKSAINLDVYNAFRDNSIEFGLSRRIVKQVS